MDIFQLFLYKIDFNGNSEVQLVFICRFLKEEKEIILDPFSVSGTGKEQALEIKNSLKLEKV